MGDLKLQGSGGIFGKEQPIQHRKLPEGVDAKQIQGMTKGNNLDEIVVENKIGERHVVYADELSVKDGKMPKVGDKVNLAFLDDEVKVIHVDDEINEDRTMVGMGVGFGLLGLAATRLAGGSASGDDTEIKRFSEKADVSEKEMKWAKDVQDKSLKGKKPAEADQARFNDIMTRYAEQQKRENAPYLPDSKVSNGDLQWALKLEKQVHKAGYEPNPEETKRYQEVYHQLLRENPVKEVPQSEIDWALKLENKVKSENYQPTDKEIARYQGIAQDLSGQTGNRTIVGLSPLPTPVDKHVVNPKPLPMPDKCGTTTDKKARVSDEELDWANQLQQHVINGYIANEKESAAYQNIYARYQNEQPRSLDAKPQPAKPKKTE